MGYTFFTMPKKGLTDEEKEKLFETWKEGPEFAVIQKFIGIRGSVKPLEMGVRDISDNY